MKLLPNKNRALASFKNRVQAHCKARVDKFSLSEKLRSFLTSTALHLSTKKPRSRVVLNLRSRPYCRKTADKFQRVGRARASVKNSFTPQQKTTLSRGFKWCAQQEARYTNKFYDDNFFLLLSCFVCIVKTYVFFCLLYCFLWLKMAKSTTLLTTLIEFHVFAHGKLFFFAFIPVLHRSQITHNAAINLAGGAVAMGLFFFKVFDLFFYFFFIVHKVPRLYKYNNA